MAKNFTLLEIKDEARSRADQQNSGFVTDKELVAFINKSVAKLYDLLISAYGNEYNVIDFPFKLTNNTDRFPLPDDFYKLNGVDLDIGPNNAISIKKFNFHERNRYDGAYYNWGLDGGVRVRYRLVGDNIVFTPIPVGNFDVKLWYVPVAPILVDDDDEMDGVNGFEEYVIIDVAIKMLQKEESDTASLMIDRKDEITRIEQMAENRDTGQGDSVSDVQNMNYDFLDGVY